MSLYIYNAFRYPLAVQAQVHRSLMSNSATVTAAIANELHTNLGARLAKVPPERWKENALSVHNDVPESALSALVDIYAEDYDRERFVKRFNYEAHVWRSNNGSHPMFKDADIWWSYRWDSTHGYVVVYAPDGVNAASILAGLDTVLEPFDFDDRVGESTHPSLDYDEVSRIWHALLADDEAPWGSPAIARLDGYELMDAFGVVG